MPLDRNNKAESASGKSGHVNRPEIRREDRPYLLTVAGFDNTAGAGLLADVKTFSLFGFYGLGVPTAVTVQTPDMVLELLRQDTGQMRKSLESSLQSFEVCGMKSGLLCDEATIDVLRDVVKRQFRGVFVVDPVSFSSGGTQILNAQARLAMVEKLFPLASVVTPNVDEAELLTSVQVRTRQNLLDCAERLLSLGPKAVLIKGSGRFDGEDCLFDGSAGVFLPAQTELASSSSTPSVHGTGCFHSASLLCLLVAGMSPIEAATKAKYLTEKAILTSLSVGGFKSRLIDHCAVRPFAAECL
ncbi:MAG: hydroxymethylpyrimidine/phosphomethylpyrimidine kinase [Candidatus Coatesbacteria bacterium]|nr:hydroxymethylpyrimidine/phosphomethylpyrimidine kinase [Candidatus Coatesbacteria bacterium]